MNEIQLITQTNNYNNIDSAQTPSPVSAADPACIAADLSTLNVAFVVDTSCGLSGTDCFIQSQGIQDLIATIKGGLDPAISIVEYFFGGAAFYVCPCP